MGIAGARWLGLWLLLGGGACHREVAGCPEGTRSDAARSRVVLSLLGSSAEGAALLGASSPRAICFSARDTSVVDATGTLLLDERRGDAELAARAGHLLTHRQAPVFAALDRPLARDCTALAREAASEEVRSRALEVRLRRGLGIESTLGDPAVDGDVYRARCEAARLRPSSDPSARSHHPPQGDLP